MHSSFLNMVTLDLLKAFAALLLVWMVTTLGDGRHE
jgi:hypothetical protein